MGVSLAGSNPARSVILYYKQLTLCIDLVKDRSNVRARLAQSVEHQTFNLRVKGSSPLLGAYFYLKSYYVVLEEIPYFSTLIILKKITTFSFISRICAITV